MKAHQLTSGPGPLWLVLSSGSIPNMDPKTDLKLAPGLAWHAT